MRPPDPAVRGQLLDYLAAVFPEHMGGGAAAPATGGLEDMPDGEGRILAFATCTACHGIRIVKAQGMSRARWGDTIQVMIEKNGMPAPDSAVRDEIIDYLARAFPERRGRSNPFLR
jgi:mono/diheme cytochrome c family protein